MKKKKKKKNKDILRILLVFLVAVFLMLGAVALLLASNRRSQMKEQKRQEALMSIPKITATPIPQNTPTPLPTATPTPTPTPVPTILPAFDPNVYWDYWYSTNGLVTINVYQISLESVSFTFSQTDSSGNVVSQADVTAEVAGKAAQFGFTDSQGIYATGTMTFDGGQFYVKIANDAGASAPGVNCIMTRERPQIQSDPTPTPEITPTQAPVQETGNSGEYYFPESGSRYLTDEEVQNFSSSELELAKNEIYARHGRIFVTQRIADYFNSKSWYSGTVDPETFDAQQDSIFNEYELANIAKISQWEEQKRNAGQ